jgi:hypothetical protein
MGSASANLANLCSSAPKRRNVGAESSALVLRFLVAAVPRQDHLAPLGRAGAVMLGTCDASEVLMGMSTWLHACLML